MGGKAFTSGPSPLSTPRMPPNVYSSLRDHYIVLLKSLYTHVATPLEAPSKASYGDVDILVSGPKSQELSTCEILATTIAAERAFSTSGSPTTSFAVPYPNLRDSHVQIDIHLCSPESFKWQLFHQSHGDLWNLLGTTIRPFGLTATDAGLHLRIAEIEHLDRKKSLLLLTREPAAVVDFLGLDEGVLESPFGSVEDMFLFVEGCRFFRGERYGREGLKANDRKRMAQREVYRKFVEEWVPKRWEHGTNVGNEKGGSANERLLIRESVLNDALERFEKRDEYGMRVSEWRQERAELLAKQEGRAERKADAVELEEHAKAWMNWLDLESKQPSD